MKKQLASIILTGTLLCASAIAQQVMSSNIVGGPKERPMPITVTGGVAVVSTTFGGRVSQIAGTGIPVVICGLIAGRFNGPAPVNGSTPWMEVTSGTVGDILVDGKPIALASQTVSNGVLRTKQFGICSIYLYGSGQPVALKMDQVDSLKKWLDAQKPDAGAEQQRPR